MKKIIFALLAFAFLTTQAQTVDDIIQKYASALGGLDNFNKIKTAKLTGTVIAQGNDLPITVQIINGKAVRSDVEVMGQTITNSYKDGKGWKINAFAGAPTVTDLTAVELNDLKTQSFLASQLMDYKARGYKVELSGQEDVEGKKAYKIKLTAENNKTTTYYIEAATSMLIKSIGTKNMMGQDIELETYYSDIKDFGNIKLSMSRIQKSNGQVVQEVHFEKMELDVPLDEKIFDKQ